MNTNLLPNEKIWVKEILNWVVVAARDLHLDELEAGASLTDQIRCRKQKKAKLWHIEKTLSRCGSILRVAAVNQETERKTVSLVHDSFRLFITDPEQCCNEFLVQANQANTAISRACLAYLRRETVRHQDGIVPQKLRDHLNYNYPLFSYASLFWSAHLLAVRVESNEHVRLLVDAVLNFCTSSNIFNWTRSVIAYSDQSRHWFEDIHLTQFTPVIIAALQWVSMNQRTYLKSSKSFIAYPDGIYIDPKLLSRAATGVATAWIQASANIKKRLSPLSPCFNDCFGMILNMTEPWIV